MIVFVDGYNWLRSIYGKTSYEEERAHARTMIRSMEHYKVAHGAVEVTLVFDGGLFSHKQREVHHGIVVVYAGRGCSADDAIIEYIEKMRGQEVVVVSNDRKLVRCCKENGAEVLPVDVFAQYVAEAVVEQQVAAEELQEAGIEKYASSDGEFVDDDVIDVLMIQASLQKTDKKVDDEPKERFRTARTKKSKQERARVRLYNKLRVQKV